MTGPHNIFASSAQELTPVVAHPTFTNAHAQMCAVITAITDTWGEPAEQLLRTTYRRLGHRTGAEMVATGVVPIDADVETYGRVSEQIMDTCGLEGWTRLQRGADEHRTLVPGCAAYLPLFEHLGAPANICAIPFEWDNGCLDTINPELEVWPTRCTYAGDGECHYTISSRAERGTRPLGLMVDQQVQPSTPVAVRDQPTWTNPTAGLLALIGSAAQVYGAAGMRVMTEAMSALGTRAGLEELVAPCGLEVAIDLLVRRYRAAGFVDAAQAGSTCEGAVLVELGENPYRLVLEHFSSSVPASTLFSAYDTAWASALRGLSVDVVADSWTGAAVHRLAITLGEPT